MATGYDDIVVKLEHFIRKFYRNELLRGSILFLFFGLLYFLLVTGLEYFFWFNSTIRKILFVLFLIIEFTLFIRFILWPVFKLLKLAKGINHFQAAQIIGKHFPEVEDQLVNVLQLKAMQSAQESDLLMAGIDQKAEQLHPIPFHQAIHFSANLKYVKFLILPVIFILVLWGLGKSDWYTQGYKRLSNYNQAYEPPAPFSFRLLNENLTVEEGNAFTLQVGTMGKIAPAEVEMVTDQGTRLLVPDENGIFAYHFENLEDSFSFLLKANGVESAPYQIKVIKTPHIQEIRMEVNYPGYLHQSPTSYKGLQNIRVPEGSTVKWWVNGNHVDQVHMALTNDSVYDFKQKKDSFEWSGTFTNPLEYQISSSNKQLPDYERLHSRIAIVKDQFPELRLESQKDSTASALYFKGQAVDDYGLTGLYLRYYKESDKADIKSLKIPMSSTDFNEFYAVFPDTVELEKGESYALFFEVFDNDGVNGPKRTRSETFSLYEKTDREKEKDRLENSRNNISEFENSLNRYKENDNEINKFKKESLENDKSDFKLRNSLKDILNRENDFVDQAKQLTHELEQNLKELDNDSSESTNLNKRLEKNQEELSKKEELLKELEKYSKELSNEKLNEKLKDYNQQRKNQFRSLESLLELTKRLYVKQKNKQLAKALKELKTRQEELIKDQEKNSRDQENVNDDFENWQESFSELEEENQELRNPKDLSRNENTENAIKEKLQEAFDKLKKAEEVKRNNEDNNESEYLQEEGEQKQQEGADMMQDLLDDMESDLQEMDREQLEEDAGMLRRILANLLTFSFDQEDLMKVLENSTKDAPNLGHYIQHQQSLKENFQHVDDSLYALALRNAMVSDAIFDEINNVDYNMELGLENLSKSRIFYGVSNQRYILTSSNELANLLDDALQNMEMQMKSMGTGQGSMPQSQPMDGEGEFQLDDIIKSQQELMEQLKGSDGEKPTPGDDNNGDEEGDANGKGNDDSGEESYEETFEIYKQQAELREKMNQLLDRLNEGDEHQSLRREMEEMEEDILNGNRDGGSQKRMETIMKRMLRLKEALYDKEKDDKREARSNTEHFEGNKLHYEEEIKKKFGTEEILNRQALPLQNLYKKLIKDYFQGND